MIVHIKGFLDLDNVPYQTLGGSFTAGWIHYLAFDLMVGLFIVTDAARLGIAHWWLLPALFLTLMFGPAGLLLYFATRYFLVPGAMLVVM